MAIIGDKFSKISTGVRPVTTTVDGTRATSGGTLSCADLTGWDTDTAVHGVTYKVDGQGAIVAGSQLDFKGIVSGNTITNFTVTGGTDAGNAVGDIVQVTPTAAWAKDLADGLLVSHDQDGTLKAGAVDNAAALASNVVTTAKILDSNVTTAKIADSNITAEKLSTSAIYLGSASITSNFSTTSTTDTIVTGLSSTVTVPAGGRKVKISVVGQSLAQASARTGTLSIWDGTVGSGTQLASQIVFCNASSINVPVNVVAIHTPAAGSKTYNVGIKTDNAANATVLTATATSPALLLVEAV